ncbi:Nif11-like leader peptide family natural product precursor [Synechococcus sp. RS9916]|uniref:Nif11-like leader peptide family natural product precursor n=1 Tax=Synechococcus sp. RS9916 TaxID=221359 RepID=UPI0000E53D66|nr:Nif11-like leader peptide family natural product precursor [Synechococcus sp. RS9916]EAU73016.1 hypothetical protein RS9916_25934 [Synechococcus sp. RS9916]
MSKEQLKAFLQKIKGDTNLQDRLKAAKSKDDVVSIAKEHGHEFETVHFDQLSENELEGVAGGGTRCMSLPALGSCYGPKSYADGVCFRR